MFWRRLVVLACAWLGAASVATCGQAVARESSDAESVQFFEKHIRPVLIQECYPCHSASGEQIEGGLALDTRHGIRVGGERGPAVVPGDVRRSVLIEAIRHAGGELKMPPDKKLSPQIIENFERWIASGAADPRDGKPVAASSHAIDVERGRRFWSFQPPREATPPDVQNGNWPRNAIDRFLLAALEREGLEPVEDSDARTLLRRLYLDLIGLPPGPQEVSGFVTRHAADPEAAIAEVADRLLDSPRFGEKWARHWLDVARYAESTGKTVNFYYPQAWRYRDYVIAAFNADKPYDQFIREQLAGDLMPSEDPAVRAERIIATGFLALGPKTLNERSGLKFELDVVDEQIDVTSQAFLGISAACARCHDHKFDPISQADYYALAGIFRSTETCYGTVRYINAQRPTPLIPLPPEADVPSSGATLSERERQRVEDQIQSVRDSMRSARDGLQQFFAMGRISLLRARLDGFDAQGQPKPLAMGVRDKPAGRNFGGRDFGNRQRRFGGAGGFTYDGTRFIADSPVYLRGEPDRPDAERVPRGTLQVLSPRPLEIPTASSGRLELAAWIASPDNPLTARVLVNRIWLKLFGRGLVPTADDFGRAGRPPTHPELLDHLALRFMEDGWSVKALIRRIVTSRAYRLASTADAEALRVDPDNTLLWRIAPRRLDAELLRDAVLAVSGQLETTPPAGSAVARAGEGPATRPFAFRDPVLAAINDPRNTQRSIYLPIVRDNLPDVLALFDAADPALIVADRQQTTVASQGLFLLNNEFVLRAGEAAAEGLLETEGETNRFQTAFLRFYSRPASERELQAGSEFLASYRATLTDSRLSESRREREAWAALCQALFASAEFQYRR